MDMGWVNPLDGLGWVWVRFFIYYILLNCNSKQTQSHSSIEDGTVSLCIDMYTDDYRKQSYLDVKECPSSYSDSVLVFLYIVVIRPFTQHILWPISQNSLVRFSRNFGYLWGALVGPLTPNFGGF